MSTAAGQGPVPLEQRHAKMLRESAISDDVMRARGYESLSRTMTDVRPADRLKRAGISSNVWNDPLRFPGLAIPLHDPLGHRSSLIYRPDAPRKDEKGRKRKYEAPVGRPAVLDVHPFNTGKMSDPQVELWVTEGVKKGDAITTAGGCVISLMGVFGFRSTHGTLGGWEDVVLKGRTVYVCFDSDAATNRNVARAMRRLGNWLRSRGATVKFIVCPSVAGLDKTGVDDWLAAGGNLADLKREATSSPPDPGAGDDRYSDSRMAEAVANDVLVERFRYVTGIKWLHYNGHFWRECEEATVVEEVRQHIIDLLTKAVAGEPGEAQNVGELVKLQSAQRLKAITGLVKGIECLRAEAADFDADPELFNAGNGVVDLRTLELFPHNPALLMRRGTDVPFYRGARHPDWDLALEAFPDASTRAFAMRYLGNGAIGTPPQEDVVCVWQGGGANGKSTLLGGVQNVLGSYAQGMPASLLGGRREEHPTELMGLMGTRLAFLEETSEGHHLNMVKIKKITGTQKITARKIYHDFVSFQPSHALLFTTNHRPVVSDVDDGTWRRLLLVPFPKIFTGQALDTGLRIRILNGPEQQQAVLAWVLEGAQNYLNGGLGTIPEEVAAATRDWREQNDVLCTFVPQNLVAEKDGFVETRHLHQRFNDWLPHPHKPWGLPTFGERLENHITMRELGAVRGKHTVSRRAGFKGIALKPVDGYQRR